MQLMIFVVIQNLICVITNVSCCYCIEPKKEAERNEWVKSDFLTDNADFVTVSLDVLCFWASVYIVIEIWLEYRVIQNDCRGFNNLSYTIHLRWQYMYFFYLIEQHSKFLLHTLQVLYMYTLCDSTNINMIIEFILHVSGGGFSVGSDSYCQFRDTHAPCLLKLCIPPSNGIVRWWLFPEFG